MPSDATDISGGRPENAPESRFQPNAFWPRAAFMALFAVFFSIAQTTMLIVAVLQALWLAFAKAPNPRIRAFGASLAIWLTQAARFQSCASEDKPFPWADWPKG